MNAIEELIGFVERYADKRFEGFKDFSADEARTELAELRKKTALVDSLLKALSASLRLLRRPELMPDGIMEIEEAVANARAVMEQK